MSNLNDFSEEDSFDFLCNNEEQINSVDGDVDISTDEHRPMICLPKQADRAYSTEICPRLFVISFVILLYAISYNICI